MKTRWIQRLFFLIIAFLLCTSVAHAQLANNGGAEPILVTYSPEHPQARETVSFTVQSYLTNLDSASIEWYVNGSLISHGTGVKTFSTTLGALGTQSIVKVIVNTLDGNTITQSFPLTASRVDLVWEADSYTPPFYHGKALLTARETGHVVAIPHFSASATSLSPSNYIYTWSRDGRVVGNASGYGRSTFFLTSDMTINPTTISVVVSNKDGSVSAQGSVAINLVEPKVITYANIPELGTLYNTALQGTFKFNLPVLNIVATPYYFSSQSSLPYVGYSWMMNNRVLDVAGNVLALKNDATSTGMSVISAKATGSLGNSVQSDTTSFTLSF